METNTSMRLWILKPIKGWDPWYDRTFGVIVRATSELEARTVAATPDQNSHDPGEDVTVWRDPTLTTCEQLLYDDCSPPGVVMRDFAAA